MTPEPALAVTNRPPLRILALDGGGAKGFYTLGILDELEKNLIGAGSSMEKVLKVNVYLNDINDWARMNTVYAGRWGKIPPVRTTVAPAGGIPGNSLVEIDLIAYI